MNSNRRRRLWPLLLMMPLLYTGCSATWLKMTGQVQSRDWRSASREPAGLAPDPAITTEAVVQVYSARAVRWRGYFGVHTWVAVKPKDAAEFTVHEVNGHRLRRTGTSLITSNRAADSRWFGNRPELLADLRGEQAEAVIQRIEAAIERYPYKQSYRVWPGPNSNTFTAFVLREAPELRVDLPPTAIGKDYLGAAIARKLPSGTGGQINLFGLAGIAAGLEEGIELSVIGLTFGLDLKDPALKLPLVGRVGVGN